MEAKLVLEDLDGAVVRAYQLGDNITGDCTLQVVRRSDNRRIEVVSSTEALDRKKIAYQKLTEFKRNDLKQAPLLIGQLGHLKLLEDIQKTEMNMLAKKEDDRKILYIFLAVVLFAFLVAMFIKLNQAEMVNDPEEMKQEVVRIIQNRPVPPKVAAQDMTKPSNETQVVKEKMVRKESALKRMGALSALGSLSKSNQKGGIDLGAVNTTAGPGLGGTQGSGGVQTSLYGKGVVAAPLGAGANLQGSGGYGTKGKGGGQAGYGKLSLTGSSGANPMALTQEATVESGLDKDQIAAVINRNLGQVRFCYEQGLQGNPNLSGRVAVDFTISPSGMVSSAQIANTTINSKMIEDCIVLRLKTWKFPLPQGGASVKVSYPFNLKRAGQG